MTSELRIGCSSWTSEAWWGKVYPPGLEEKDRLPFYAKLFDTVEVDSSYYRAPSSFLIEGWRRRTPAGFLFTLKFPRDLLDARSQLKAEEVASFCQRARGLGEKLGAIVLQYAPWVKPGPAKEKLTELWDALDPGLRFAVELRDPDWFEGEEKAWLLRELASRRIALVWSFLTYVDVPPELTTNLLYLRFIGDHTTVPPEAHGELRVDRSAVLDLWAHRVQAASERVERTFVFFNNHFQGFAPASVNLFRQDLGLPPVDYAPAVRQTRLPEEP